MVETIVATPNGGPAKAPGQTTSLSGRFAWIGSLPKLNAPFVVNREGRRVINWAVIGMNLVWGLGLVCLLLPIMLKGMDFDGRIAGFLQLLFLGLFAVVFTTQSLRGILSPVASLPAESGVRPSETPDQTPFWRWGGAIVFLIFAAVLLSVNNHYSTPATVMSQSEFFGRFRSNEIAHATIKLGGQGSPLALITGTYFKTDNHGKVTREEVPFVARNFLLPQRTLDELLASGKVAVSAQNGALRNLFWGVAPFLILGVGLWLIPVVIIFVVWRVVRKSPPSAPVAKPKTRPFLEMVRGDGSYGGSSFGWHLGDWFCHSQLHPRTKSGSRCKRSAQQRPESLAQSFLISRRPIPHSARPWK